MNSASFATSLVVKKLIINKETTFLFTFTVIFFEIIIRIDASKSVCGGIQTNKSIDNMRTKIAIDVFDLEGAFSWSVYRPSTNIANNVFVMIRL